MSFSLVLGFWQKIEIYIMFVKGMWFAKNKTWQKYIWYSGLNKPKPCARDRNFKIQVEESFKKLKETNAYLEENLDWVGLIL